MDQARFNNLFPGLGQQEAIAILSRPIAELEDVSDRYLAASHLINFPGPVTTAALVACAADQDPAQAQRIARRKAVESLARLDAREALGVIAACLGEEDIYLVETASWALAALACNDPVVHRQLIALLADPRQIRRVIIQALARLGVRDAIPAIAALRDDDDGMVAMAAITATARLAGDRAGLHQLQDYLLHPDVTLRRAVIQDLMDGEVVEAADAISSAPVSPVFRLRGARHLAELQRDALRADPAASRLLLQRFDRLLRDHPDDLTLVHAYDRPPDLAFLVRELYGTDFGRSYLAISTLERQHGVAALPALTASFADEGWNDYGAHYHLIHLFGRLGDAAVLPLVRQALDNQRPQFQKSRPAAALALARLEGVEAIPALNAAVTEDGSWELRYAALMALDQLGKAAPAMVLETEDWLVRLRATAAPLA